MKVRVNVVPKPAILDPAGVATATAIQQLGISEVSSVRIGKLIEIELEQATEEQLHAICSDLLSNPVIEDYYFEIEDSL